MAQAFILNSTTLSSPDTFDDTTSDIDSSSSGRNANQLMMRDIIATKKSFKLNWTLVKKADAQAILRIVKQMFFTLTYDDIDLGVRTITCMCGDRSVSKVPGDEYVRLSFTIVER